MQSKYSVLKSITLANCVSQLTLHITRKDRTPDAITATEPVERTRDKKRCTHQVVQQLKRLDGHGTKNFNPPGFTATESVEWAWDKKLCTHQHEKTERKKVKALKDFVQNLRHIYHLVAKPYAKIHTSSSMCFLFIVFTSTGTGRQTCH
ncbi:hypothetical protein AVEN_68482-1 [Araneus ventricosus]|uniref:Uncharacterized protein n=1 Tax=Araneus ventricosus TaxID=182803 RepID=A0A4Y2RM06_ARAVE|nr:hypothetical protein AVEN_99299-1 [Araneus ventricosus]GBN76289.1 hypothetical protein AVEN_68482-1 [Araneus ventricosus]